MVDTTLKAPTVNVFGDDLLSKMKDSATGFITTPPRNGRIPNLTSEILNDLYTSLELAELEGGLSEKGIRLKKFIEEGAITPDYLGSYLQGTSANLSDEGIALLNSAFNQDQLKEVSDVLKSGQMYKEQTGGTGAKLDVSPTEVAKGLERRKLKAFQEENPILSPVIEMGGAITTMLATKGKSIGGAANTIPQMIGQGGLYGGLSGYGQSEGGFAEQATGTGTGIALGGTFGGVLGVGRNVLGSFKDFLSRSFTSQSSQAKKMSEKLFKEILESDFGSIDEALLAVANANKSGKPYVLADLTNNTQLMLDIAKKLPNPNSKKAFDFLVNRNKGMMVRLQNDTTKAFGKRGQLFSEVKALQETRGKIAGPIYRQANKVKIDVDDELTQILARPSMREAYKLAVRMAEEEGVKLPNIFLGSNGMLLKPNPTIMKKLGYTMDDVNDPTKLADMLQKNALGQIKQIDTEFLHFMKTGLDRRIFANKGSSDSVERMLTGLEGQTRRQFLALLDKKNPLYKKARNIYASDTATLDSYTLGANLFKKEYTENIDMLTDMLSKMTASEKEAFRTGAVNSIMNALGGVAEKGEEILVSTDMAKKFLRDPKIMRALKVTFNNPKKFDEFQKNLLIESQMLNTYQKIFNSATFPREVMYKKMFGKAVQADGKIEIVDEIFKLLSSDARFANEQTKQMVAKNILDKLVDTDLKGMQKFIATLKTGNVDKTLQWLGKARRTISSPYVTGQQIGNVTGDWASRRFYTPIPQITQE